MFLPREIAPINCLQDRQDTLYKKYHHGDKTVDGVDTTVLTANLMLGIGRIGVLFVIIAVQVVMSLEIAAIWRPVY